MAPPPPPRPTESAEARREIEGDRPEGLRPPELTWCSRGGETALVGPRVEELVAEMVATDKEEAKKHNRLVVHGVGIIIDNKLKKYIYNNW